MIASASVPITTPDLGVGDLLLVVSSLPSVALGITIAGIGIPWAVVGLGTAVQRRTPADLQGRVYSAADTIVGTPQTLSIAVGAGLSTLVDYRVLLVIMAAVTTGCALYLITRRSVAPLEPAQHTTANAAEGTTERRVTT